MYQHKIVWGNLVFIHIWRGIMVFL